MIDTIHWLGHSSFRIDGDVTIYIDPWKLGMGNPPADLILISHEHHDHFSPEDIELVRTADTDIVTIATVAQSLSGKVQTVQPGDRISVRGIEVQALPAYNKSKRFHPRAKGHVGFLITIGGGRIYFAGDTDAIPEMAGLRPDVALIPVSGVYVMDPAEAAEAVRLLEPELVVPMHYGDIVGGEQEVQAFEALSSAPVHVLQAER